MSGGEASHPVRVPELADTELDQLISLNEPLRRIVQPYVSGIENVPDGGALLVGNHTVLGLMDVPFMVGELWHQRRIWVRGLGEHVHYKLPGWRDLLERGGMVRGTRDNVRELMRRREPILVFPGGAREVSKQRGEKYQLIWKERIGFAKLAIEFGYPVVPFAAVGAEEMFEIVADGSTLIYGQIAAKVEQLVKAPAFPLVRGVGPTPLPRPERLYFKFSEPVETGRLGGDPSDDNARAVRDETRAAVEAGIEELLAFREEDPLRGFPARLKRLVRGS